MITIDRPATVIDQLPSIDLDELVARAALLTRLDRKYVLTTSQLDEMLRALPSGVQALEIDGRRTFDYQSVYYDTRTWSATSPRPGPAGPVQGAAAPLPRQRERAGRSRPAAPAAPL